eukprot:jgi/Galph1/4123/GphlegSOOS_G2788.1
MASLRVFHDTQGQRFIVSLTATAEAFLKYRVLNGNVLDFYHTFVPPEGRGTGVASRLCDEAFSFAKYQNFKVKPSCSYVSKTYLPKHPELLSYIID